MTLSLPATGAPLGLPHRLLLFGATAGLGFLGGLAWNLEGAGWLYIGLIQLFADPAIQVTSLAVGLGVAFLLGFVHITSI